MALISILEKGNIYFFYRPKIEREEVQQLKDIQRFFIALKPKSKDQYVLIVVGKKKLPEKKEESNFAFIEKIFKKAEDLSDALKEQKYSTSTRGNRKLAPVRAVGEGTFILAQHEQHTHLLYQLKTPEEPGEVQKDFHINKKGDYIISVKNPEKSSPPYIGLSSKEKTRYPKKHKRFIPLHSSEFLNYEEAKFVLTSKCTPDLTEKEPIV